MNTAIKSSILFVCLVGAVLASDPDQDILFETIDITDGLSQNSVSTMAKDKYGFMWLGTEDGLNRWDGLEFKIYRHDPVDSTALLSNSITSTLIDHLGNLWIGTYTSGIHKYLYETDDFRRYVPNPDKPFSIGKGSVLDMVQDDQNHIWIATEESGLYRFEETSGKFIPLQDLTAAGDSLLDPMVMDLHLAHDQKMWIATAGGLQVLNLVDYSLASYIHDPDDPTSLYESFTTAVYETYDGDKYDIWVGTYWGGLDRLDASQQGFTHFGSGSGVNPDFPETSVNAIIQASPDRLWIGTYTTGIQILDMEGKVQEVLLRKSYDDSALRDDIVQSFYDDGEILWVGTSSGGFSRLLRNRKKFYNLTYDPLNPQGLHDNRISRLAGRSDGKIWVATWSKGLALYDPSNHTFTQYRHDKNNAGSLSNDDVQDIIVDRNDNLWVISASQNVDVLLSGSDEFIHLPGSADSSNGLFSDYLQCIYEDRAGNIWLGSWAGGLIKADPKTLKFETITEPAVNDINLGSISTYVIFEDSRGMLWLGAEIDGLLGFNPKDNSLIQFRSSPGDPHALSTNDVMYMYEDSDHIIWIATYGGGLTRFDPEQRTFTTFDREVSLKSNTLYALFEDRNGLLWMSTNDGISSFNKESHEFRHYGVPDGVLSKEFNPAAYQSSQGRIYFGGVAGITYFQPEEITQNTLIPPVQFTELSILNRPIRIGAIYDGQTVLPQAITLKPDLHLAPEHLTFNIKFVSLDYSHPESNQYAYKLEGFDDEWNTIGPQHDATFTNLPVGQYTLLVKGSNSDGIWNETPSRINIIRVPAFHETWLSKILLAAFLALLVIIVFRARTAYLVRRGEELRAHNTKLNAEVQSRREAHRRARERADYFRAVISQSPIPMAIHNLDGNITHLNRGWVEMWAAESAENLIRDYQIETDPIAVQMDLNASFISSLRGEVIEHKEMSFLDGHGRNRIAHILLYPLRTETGETHQVMISIQDITEIVDHRHLLEKSLREKELLLKEVHHRVKNNLQIIASLLGLQKAGTMDPATTAVLDDFRSRVNSMALVHDALYRSPEIDEINISNYLSGLIGELQFAFEQSQHQINLVTDIPDITLSVDLAVPCGLIVNELVTNAFKYAFKDSMVSSPEIQVKFSELPGDWVQMEIKDNGRGFQQEVVWDSVDSLGLYLVKILSENQLMGEVDLIQDTGSHFIIKFPLNPDFNS